MINSIVYLRANTAEGHKIVGNIVNGTSSVN